MSPSHQNALASNVNLSPEYPGDVAADGSGEDEGHAQPEWAVEVRVRPENLYQALPQRQHARQHSVGHLPEERDGQRQMEQHEQGSCGVTCVLVTSKKPW